MYYKNSIRNIISTDFKNIYTKEKKYTKMLTVAMFGLRNCLVLSFIFAFPSYLQ